MAKREVIELLKKFITLLKTEGFLVEKAFLYGSYLTNTATSNSDIDLLLVTDDANDDDSVGKIWSLTQKVSTKIEPFLVTKDRFYFSENSPLIESIKTNGLEIFS